MIENPEWGIAAAARPVRPVPTTATPVLSVVVIGRNEGARLERCLAAVAAMHPLTGPTELIYVDSASSDDSVERATRKGARVINVNPARPCAAVGRNAGWRAARGPLVLFLDGDSVLEPDFVTAAIGEFRDPRIGVVFGHIREINPRASIFNRVIDLDWDMPLGPVDFCGGNALIRREALEAAGGYDERLIAAEDTELCWWIRSRGYIVLHIDRPMATHDLAMNRVSQYWRRAIRSGYAYAELSERFRHSRMPLWANEPRRHLLHGSLLLAVLCGAPLLSLLLWMAWPVLLALAFVAALSVRTAFRPRRASAGLLTRLLHGLHSHLMKIPLMFGQFKYRRDRCLGRRAALMEYKDIAEPASAPH